MDTLRHLLFPLLAFAFFAMASVPSDAWALQPGSDGWYVTGDGVRTKKIAFVNVKVYSISHAAKKLPDTKSKPAMIDLDSDKKFTLRMLRDIDVEKIQSALRDSYGQNGFGDAGRMNAFLAAFTHDLKEGTTVSIGYDSAAKSTTIRVAGTARPPLRGPTS